MAIKECGGRIVWCDENCEACLATKNTTSTEDMKGENEK